MTPTEQAKVKALGMGIELKGEEKLKDIQALIDAAELAANNPGAGELSPEEIAKLKAESDATEAKLKAEADAKSQKTYSEAEVDAKLEAMKAAIMKEFQAQNGLVDDDKDDPELKRTVRVPRFDKKFIVGFKNLNDDPYFPDRVVYSKDVFNDQTKQMVPHVTFVFEDESTITMPFETMLKVANAKTPCEIIDRGEKVEKVKLGTVEKQEMKQDGYGMMDTGEVIQAKQIIKTPNFTVKTPDGKILHVQPEVVNW